jgi:hypothetical protein
MRRRWILSGIVVAIAAVVLVAPTVIAAVAHPAVNTLELPEEKQYSFLVGTSGTFFGHPGFVIILQGTGTFGGPEGLTGAGVFSIYNGSPSPSNTVATGMWNAADFIHYQGWGGLNARAFGGQLTIMVAVHVDNGPSPTGKMVVTCLLGHPPSGMKEGVTVSGRGVNFNNPLFGVTLFSKPASSIHAGLGTHQGQHLALIASRQSLGACHLGCC